MRYKDYEGSIEELVGIKLQEIEQQHGVKVLYAVESGSRAWGFASPDSDYDVRFIYIRKMNDYLSLQESDDFINGELDEVLDINGWDLTKTLRAFQRGNATLYEWAGSPVRYYASQAWDDVALVAEDCFSCKAAMCHYYGTARKTYQEYLRSDMVRYKKYFYALRPLLACRWIEEKRCAPPVLFADLMSTVLENDMIQPVQELLQKKVTMTEGETAPKMDAIDRYIREKLAYYKALSEQLPDDRNRDWEPLNAVFRNMLHIETSE